MSLECLACVSQAPFSNMPTQGDRKSTRLNSSHITSSYAVFCLKKKNTYQVGWVVDQTTSAFDELHHRMDADNVAEFQRLTEQAGKQFKNEKPIELAKFEVSHEY